MTGVSGNSRSRSFPRMEASDSRSRTLGMDFFIPFPFPNFGNGFFHSLPVPKLWEWKFFIPFPFPNWPFQSRESKGKMVDCERFFRVFFGTLPLFSEHFTTFSISSNHRNFFVPFPFPFPSIPGNNSLWFPFPNFGNVFFHSLPVPEFRECLFSFPSRSRILGMDFFIPFPFPNFGNGNFSFPSRSRIDHFKVGNKKGKWKIVRDASIPTFSASSTFHTTWKWGF